MLHCDFCGATLTDEDRSCRTCGSAVTRAPVATAAPSSSGTPPLRQWGGETHQETANGRATLYEWQAPASVEPEVTTASDLPFDKERNSSTRQYSRLRVYLAAAMVAVVIVVAYMLVAGADTGSGDPTNRGPAQDVPTAEATTAPVNDTAAEPATSQLAPDSAEAPASATDVTEDDQPENSLTLTFDPPPASSTETPAPGN